MKFIADAMLGKLSKYLRMLGFDTLYFNHIEDTELIEISKKENRTILTKDKIMVREKKPENVLLIESVNPVEQAKEVVKAFNLIDKINPFSRCLECNNILKFVKAFDVKDIPENVKKFTSEFYLCEKCKKYYWYSVHTERMQIIIEKILYDH